MTDLMHSGTDNIWVLVAGSVIFITFVTGLKPRVVWGLYFVALIGACTSLLLCRPDTANVQAWNWFGIPFVLIPVAAGSQKRSPLQPLLVAITGAGLSILAFLRANETTRYLAVFPIATSAIAFALYGVCRIARTSAPG